MSTRTVLFSWLVLYLLLATPGSQLVLCWAGANHFVLESTDQENCCAQEKSDPVNFVDNIQTQPDCDCPPCIDIPLSLRADWEPARKSVPPRVPESFLSGTIVPQAFAYPPKSSLVPRLGELGFIAFWPVSLNALRTVCLLI